MDSESGAACPVTLRAMQVRNYRTLRHVDLRLHGRFYVLVGPNGSGKSTLLDAVSFLFSFFNNGLRYAIEERTEGNFQDLVWGRPKSDGWFEIAVEFETYGKPFRYELRVEEQAGAFERAFMGRLGPQAFANRSKQPRVFTPSQHRAHGLQPVFRSVRRPGHVVYFSEDVTERRFSLNIPDGHSGMQYVEIIEDLRAEGDHPMRMGTALRMAECTRENGVQVVQLDSNALRSTYSPNGHDGWRIDHNGGNLPLVLERLKQHDHAAWLDWMDDVSHALPGVQDVRSVRRPEDRRMYLMVTRDGVEVPAWGVSDGTLRFLALTAIPHLHDSPVAYLLEEPENGIHPMAIEHAYQSLSNVSASQMYIASHSPTLLRCVAPEEVLCFGHHPESGTVVVRGDEHPRLSQWQGSIDDGVFWATDILTDAADP